MASISVASEDYKFDKRGKQKIFQITGRVSNPLTRAIMGLLGIDSSVVFTVNRNYIHYRFSDLSGQTTIMSPLDSITGMQGAYARPKWALFLGAVLSIGGGIGMFSSGGISAMIATLIGIALIVYFAITKELYIGFSTSDFAQTQGLHFSGTKTDGTAIDESDVLEVVEHINVLLIRTHKSGGTNRRATAEYTAIPEAKLKQDVVSTSEKEKNDAFLSDEDLRAFGILDDQKESISSAGTDAQETANAIKETIEDEIDIDALYEEAETAYASKGFEKAVIATNKILDDDPHHLDALKLRARSYHRLGNTTQAEADKAEWKRIYSAQ